jgi:heptosyltransferase-3
MNPDIQTIRKILIIKLRYIGDTVMLLPFIKNLKLQIPQAHLSVMVNKGTEEIIRYSEDIDELICYDRQTLKYGGSVYKKICDNIHFIRAVRNKKYDAVIDFTGSDRSEIITLLSGARIRMGNLHGNVWKRIYFNHLIDADIDSMHIVAYEMKALEQLGFKTLTDEYSINIPPDVQTEMDQFFFPQGIDRNIISVVIHPGARRELRRWPAERFAEIALKLKEHYNAKIFLVGGPGEEEVIASVAKSMGNGVAFQGTGLSLIQLAALLKRCDLYLGNDTGSSHVAAGTGVKMITLFGPQYPHRWAPYTKKGMVVFKNVDCIGCNHIDCTQKENVCMTSITTDEVWDKVQRQINS